jgi:hypothetical protein
MTPGSAPQATAPPALQPAARIFCELPAAIAPQARAAMAALGVSLAQVHPRRLVVRHERALLPFLPPVMRLDEDPAELFEIYVPRAQAQATLLAWAHALRLFTPGRGALGAEAVDLLSPAGAALCTPRPALPAGDAGASGAAADERLAPLVLLNCVVQRGRGNDIALCALEMGSHVPSVNFGTGTGLRDRLGLLRIAIPAEKEIVSVLVDPPEMQACFAALVAVGRLDQPGRGFIAASPLLYGLGNTLTLRGAQRHSASMDQVIAAIDTLKAGTEWRRRIGAGAAPALPQHGLRHGLLNLVLSCSEGSAGRVLAVAMGAGAAGATISRANLFSPTGAALPLLPGRELIDCAITPPALPPLLAALQASGMLADEAACALEVKPLHWAFTYVAA